MRVDSMGKSSISHNKVYSVGEAVFKGVGAIMADYIDRKALLDSICGNIIVTHRLGEPSLEIRGANKVINFIEEAPAVDVVEVPDCTKCIFNERIAGWCQCEHCVGNTHKTNNFVAIEKIDGERREE